MRTLPEPTRSLPQIRLIISMAACTAVRHLLYPILGVFIAAALILPTGCARKTTAPAPVASTEQVLDYRNGWYHFASGTENVLKIATRYRRDPDIVAGLNKLTPKTIPDSGIGVYIPPVHEPRELKKVISRVTADPELIPRTPPDPTWIKALPAVPPPARQPFKPDLIAQTPPKAPTVVASLDSDLGGMNINRTQPQVVSVSEGRLVSAMSPKRGGVQTPNPQRISSRGYRWPVQGRVLSTFDANASEELRGITIEVPPGTPVRAAKGGKVEFASEFPGYGQLVIIRDANDLLNIYGYNDRLIVTVGQVIQAGQTIGISGSPSATSTNQVFFALRRGHDPLNPTAYLP